MKKYDLLKKYLVEEGREASDIGIEGRISLNGLSDNEIIQKVKDWESVGASHLSINTMNSNLSFPKGHMKAISHVKKLIGN